MAASNKPALHPANPFAAPYPLEQLTVLQPGLQPFLRAAPPNNPAGPLTLDFSAPQAVLLLNTALLQWQYQLPHYSIPAGYLCPAVPGRLDYLLYLADLLKDSHNGKTVPARAVQLLDVGCGANLIYSLLAVLQLRWQVLACDIDAGALAHAAQLLQLNQLQSQIGLRQQQTPAQIFHGVLGKNDYLDLTLCNPPFHDSPAAAAAGTARKQRNLGQTPDGQLNFAGRANELWCDGGEPAFLQRMINESRDYAAQVYWFTTLVSREAHLSALQRQLQQAGVVQSKVIPMAQGNKQSRILAWSFLTPAQQKVWQQHRWRR